MKKFQNPCDAATPAPEPLTKNPSLALRFHVAATRATRQIHRPTQISTRHPVELPMLFLINAQNIKNHRNQLKTNNSPHF
jgi:hypothetical protein